MNSTGGKIFKLTGKVQDYAWGGKQFIPQLLGLQPSQKTAAEYWLGAHQSAPSQVITNDGNVSLKQMISDNAEETIGNDVNEAFGRLPYLLKVLDVKDMLSIQVHPSKIEAEKGFARENEEGISLSDPKRNYKDDNHKPELMLALGDFWLLHGFKSKDQLTEILRSTPELEPLVAIFENAGYEGLYHAVMQLPQKNVNEMLQPLLDRIIPQYKEEKLNKSQEDFWAARAALTYNQGQDIDRGIFSIYFLNLVQLKKGEAIFQDAGILHAYLEGQNIEIMANSDNVLRGGLTPKNIDIAELMKHVTFEPIDPWIIQGTVENGERTYKTPANDFELSSFELNEGDEVAFSTDTADIILVTEGSVQLESASYARNGSQHAAAVEPQAPKAIEDAGKIELSKGESAVVFGANPVNLHALAATTIFRATVPRSNG